jgi:uncharacterized UPF0146 family protein
VTPSNKYPDVTSNRTTADALVDRLDGHDRVVEVGIGERTDAAAGLAAAGVDVVAVDRRPVTVPEGVEYVRDDIVRRAADHDPKSGPESGPEMGPYEGADAVYARRLPPELHRPTLTVARAVGAEFVFTTLGGEPPTVPVARGTVPGGTLYRAVPEPGSNGPPSVARVARRRADAPR